MDKEQYEAFYNELINAERAKLHDVDQVYEGCMPVEIMAKRGADTLRFGPLKPVGLKDPNTGHRPWAVVQLRRENSTGSMYNIVGFSDQPKIWRTEKGVFYDTGTKRSPNLYGMGLCIAILFLILQDCLIKIYH